MDSLMNHFCAGVFGMIVDSDEVIEGFDELCFGLGGVEVGRCRRYGLRSLCFLFLSLGRSLFRSRLRDSSAHHICASVLC
jgi:hypothetical protein